MYRALSAVLLALILGLSLAACDVAGTDPEGEPIPVLANPGDQTVAVGLTLSFTLSATDLEGDPLTFSLTGLPADATLDPDTGAFTWTPTEAQAGTYNVTFTVTDSKGASDSVTIAVTVVVFTWHAEDLPTLGADFSDWGLEDVQMVSTTEGWAVGWKHEGGDVNSDEPLILRYDGTWQEEDISDLDLSGSGLGLLGVGVAPNGDVWAVGGVAGESLVLVRHNGSWSRINEPVGEGAVWPDFLEDVAFADEHNTYVAGREGGTGRVLRFVDRAYVEFFATDGELRGIDWGDQGYAVGDETGEGDIAAVRESSDATPFESNVISALDLEGLLLDVDVLSDGDGFAVGYQSGGDFDDPLILQHSGGSWTEVAAPVTATDADNFLTGVSLVSALGG